MQRHNIILAAGLLCLIMTGCSPVTRYHGHAPTEGQMQQLTVGFDNRDSVAEVVGPPTSEGGLVDDEWYYIATTVVHRGALTPKIESREIVAISFDSNGILANIERFGLQDGRIVVLNRRITDTAVRGPTFLQQLFGTFGNIDTQSIANQQ